MSSHAHESAPGPSFLELRRSALRLACCEAALRAACGDTTRAANLLALAFRIAEQIGATSSED
jgi:hypothetical protein